MTAASFPLLYHYLSRIFREFQEKEPLYQQAVHGLLFSLFSEINRITMSAADSVMSESGDSYSYIRSALSYLYAHYNEPFSVSGLAEHCCISESHLRRLFKNMVAVSYTHLDVYKRQPILRRRVKGEKTLHQVSVSPASRSLIRAARSRYFLM